VSAGLKKTLDLLAKTGNESAVDMLIPALDSADETIQEGALRALLARRSPTGHRELVRRWNSLGEHSRSLIAEHPGRISGAVRDAILSRDGRLCANGCDAALYIHEYDLMPALVNAAEDEANPHADLAGRTLLGLAAALCDELAGPRDYEHRRDPQLLRQHVIGSLELSVQRYDRHRRREIMEGFLLLVNRDNTTLKKILQDPRDKAYLAIVDVLTNSQQPGIMRLTLSYLDDPTAPAAAINILSRRGDAAFLRHLLTKIGFEPSAPAKVNLKRMDCIHWVAGDLRVLDELSNAQQHSAVQLVMASSMNRLQSYEVIRHILRNGTTGGRRAASVALAQFQGAEANQLALRAIEDSDPQVQANAFVQLRQRGIPGAMTRLIEVVDSPHAVVRDAARQCLSEFTFSRYLSAFDMLDDEVRRSTGMLVKKIDPQAFTALEQELAAKARSRRIRALQIAPLIGAVAELEGPILELLADDDHFVRAEAARALAQVDTPAVRQALRELLLDRSISVQEAAEDGLRRLAQEANEEPLNMPAESEGTFGSYRDEVGGDDSGAAADLANLWGGQWFEQLNSREPEQPV
jgi:HEAT repeat protein